MYRIASGSSPVLPDIEAFIETLNALDRHPLSAARELIDPARPVVIARAPGRLDVMGGIADYSGSLVLEMPIREATIAAVQRDNVPRFRIVSLPPAVDAGHEARARRASVEFDATALPGLTDGSVSYAAACDYFRMDPACAWAAYVAGAFVVFAREQGVRFDHGARILIRSEVPEGKGVSSSAALEVASMYAIAAAFDVSLEARGAALLCQIVENEIVGVPCGVMDQMTAALGEEGRLLSLLCQPAEVRGIDALPEGLRVWGVDSGHRHSVAASPYHGVRVGAFMGYRIMAELAGFAVMTDATAQRVDVVDPKWRGYLANVTPCEFESSFASRLPDQIRGREFLARYHGTTDPVTHVDPDTTYPVRVSTAHPIYEHDRVRRFAAILNDPDPAGRGERLGTLMYESHASYSACGLDSAGTDRLVELVRAAGPAVGLYGAKITGGGSGGTVAILGAADAAPAIRRIVEQYAGETGHAPHLFEKSSPGAAAVPPLTLLPDPAP